MTLFETATLLTILIVFAATTFRSVFGFGEALIAMPLLTMSGGIGLQLAAPLVAIISVGMATVILLRDWRYVQFGGAKILVISAIAGIPLGRYGLSVVPESTVKITLAIVIILFSLYRLTSPRNWRVNSDWWAIPFGFVGGVLGGAYNVTGPPLVMYGTMRHWSAQEFRATMQGVFLPSSIVIVLSHQVAGAITTDVWFLAAVCAPVVLVGVYLGRWINARVKAERFTVWVYYMLLMVAGLLIWNSQGYPGLSDAVRYVRS